eukprot:TRINITY_DN3123_c0_g1_i2.p1 TRINITY_DN3123_c0_g1~~TRINITY_DN3123_c0_g1_i2.p1  ORF type:complete len:259 (-),score=30.17 TRINITY_DN3123_c0_g1_i2:124-900(-)
MKWSATRYKGPLWNIPMDLINEFTMHGKITRWSTMYFDQSRVDDTIPVWDINSLTALIQKADRREQYYYEHTDLFLYHALRKFPITGQDVVIFGSQEPWYEAIALSFGANSTTSIDYRENSYDHPKMSWTTLQECLKSGRRFPIAFSISSFEHDGLGRYGDFLNPNGDLLAMKMAKKVVTDGGLLFIAVPIGQDHLVWNAHRIYGRLRLPLLFQNWEVVGTFGVDVTSCERSEDIYKQPVYVLRNSHDDSKNVQKICG